MAKRDLALDLFRAFQTNVGTHPKLKRKNIREATSRVNDPELLGDVLSQLIEERDWRSGIAEGSLFTQWSEVVGLEIASHADPISLTEGVLTIQTSSTAWATQLQLVAPDLVKRIQSSAPGVLVDKVIIIGPNGPTWKKGIRTIRGARGPRDTYG